MIYAINYERTNFSFIPPLEEKVVVFLETDLPFDNDHIDAFDLAAWDALCPANSDEKNGTRPKTTTKKV